jgi:hypothetical protein
VGHHTEPTTTMTDAELEVQQVDWGMLRPHAERGALYLLDDTEDLMAVAVAIRDDDVAKIRSLMETQSLVLADQGVVDGPDEPEFRFVIVQPYVVAQGPLQ